MKLTQDRQALQAYVDKYDLDSWFSTSAITNMQLIEYTRGEFIARSGEPLDYFLFFVKGRCKVYTVMQNGKSYLLRFYEPLQVIGDVELTHDIDSGCNCHVEALTECTCIGIPMTVMLDQHMDDPIFLRAVSVSLSEKIRSSAITNSINLLYPLESRLASYILALSVDRSEFQLNESYTDMADLLGTSYRHLSRILNKFSEQGLIIRSRHRITISDRTGLQAYAGDLML